MKNPYMPFWVNDYRTSRDVRKMRPEERGVYLDLIFELWADGELPDNDKELAELLSMNVRLFRRIFKVIRHKFVIKDGVVSHSKVSKLLLEFDSKSKQNSENAKNGWKKRKKGGKRNAGASDSQCNTESESESETIKKTNKKIQTVFDHYFKTFDKTKAYKLDNTKRKWITKALARGHEVADLISAIDAMASDDWIERPKFNDLCYAISIIKGIDNVSKWATYVPQKKLTGSQKTGVPEKDKDYGTTTRKKL